MARFKIFVKVGTRSARIGRESERYEATPKELAIAKYLGEWSRFSSKKIPFKEWEDIAEEGLALLLKFIKEDRIESYEDQAEFEALIKKFAARHNELIKRYDQLQTWFDD